VHDAIGKHQAEDLDYHLLIIGGAIVSSGIRF
jgi:hypothetical protein